ncbi:MAG: Ada metal-binding domain-containing protein, partial [Phycisphaerales bacterium]|nr:Ada metal-binding domain-containing protein [Phycisphaerales bacterium]
RMSPATIVLTWVAIAIAEPVSAATMESPAVYEIAIPVAVSALSPELRSFFDANSAALRASALQVMATTKNHHSHSLPLDCAAEGKEPEKRRAAVLRFPRDLAGARGQVKRCGREDEELLPWIVQQRFAALVESLKKGEAERIVRDAGALLHFAIDAALPFNATDTRWADALSSAFDTRAPRPRSMRMHYQVELVERVRDRFAFEARIDPRRVTSVVDPVAATYDTLRTAHAAALALEEVDREAAPRPESDKSAAQDSAFIEWSTPILETQIESGALLGAELIVSAWIEAGKPALPVATAGPASEPMSASAIAASGASRTAAALVGSRSSKIFHRANCSHAVRIKPENRVHFDTAEQARAQGRTPCKTCKPDQ